MYVHIYIYIYIYIFICTGTCNTSSTIFWINIHNSKLFGLNRRVFQGFDPYKIYRDELFYYCLVGIL